MLFAGLLSVVVARGADPVVDDPAAASDLERAEEAYRSGEQMFNEGNYEGAILAFRESLALSGKSALHFNLAYCLELLGRLEEAKAELERYAAVAPEAQRPTLDRRLTAIQARIDGAPAPPPVSTPASPPAPSVLAAPQRVRLQATDWVFMGSGLAVGGLSVAGVGLTYGAAARHLEENDRPAYKVDRALNVMSWIGTTVGAGLMITGVVRASSTTVSFDGQTVSLQRSF